MKPINRIFRNLGIAALAWMALPFTACSNADENPVVDLRYDALDEYSLPYDNPQAVTFRVRSLYTPWEVSGTDESWYTISPSHGAAGETVTVTITVKDNVELDDREDVISIKSDYWTGKKFRLFQKGTAYLSADDITLEQEGAKYSIPVLSNQKWSAKVTEGESWLTITSGATGEKDGAIGIEALTNNGEQRPGTIIVYDRYDRPTVEVIVTQNGVILNPIYPEDPDPNEDVVSWIRCYHEEQTLEIPVESNAEWTVVKGDPEFEDWFDLEQTSFKGEGTIRVKMSANAGTTVRTGTLVVSTMGEGDIIPVVRNIKFKQANERVPQTMGANIAVNGTANLGSAVCGRYDFHVQGSSGKDLRFTFYYPTYPYGTNGPRELRYWTNRANGADDGVPMISTMPWVGGAFNLDQCVAYANNANPGTYARINKNEPHVLSLDISKAKFEGQDETCAYVTWYIDGEVLALGNGTNAGIMPTKPDGTTLTATNWDMTYEEMNSDAAAYISAIGSFTITKWEYTAPINWGSAD